MRKYEKPLMQVERYQAKNAVAWGCKEEEVVTIPEQTIDCIIAGTDYVFSANCRTDAGTTGSVVTYNGTTYFVWKDTSITVFDPDTRLLTEIENATGAGVVGEHGWHAGPVTSAIDYVWNANS